MGEGRLDGRVVVITGAGRGIGREYALLAARQGARVVVNDLGSSLVGEATHDDPASEVVAQIAKEGGEAIADRSNVADWEAAGKLIQSAIQRWGRLDVLVNNAGILRDRMLVNMTPEEWDLMMNVHLRGHFCTTRHAAEHWRERSKQEGILDAALICTTSVSALHGAVGQTNYGSAKAGIATFALLCHRELNPRYGVRTYCIAPGARTRLTLSTPHAKKTVGAPVPEGAFDAADPANVAPYVMWLAAKGCQIPSGSVFGVAADRIDVYQPWTIAKTFRAGGRPWDFSSLDHMSETISAAVPQQATTVVEAANAAAKASA